jgi:hypothetical protein
MLNVFLKNGLETEREYEKKFRNEGKSAKYLIKALAEEHERFKDIDDISLTEILMH